MATLRQLQLSLTGIVALGSSVMAQEPTRPAVRLLPATPMNPVETITARAAAFDPLTPPAPDAKLQNRNDGPRIKKLFEQDKDQYADKPTEPGPWKKFTRWVDDKASGVKKKLDAPSANQPPPRVGGQAPPVSNPTEAGSTRPPLFKGGLRSLFNDKSSATPNAATNTIAPPVSAPTNATEPAANSSIKNTFKNLFTDKPATPPKEPAKVNSANPAYRWYGYGTALPGMNPYAPTGDYPNASAQWYQQSGATPGAFPTPTMNPMRPAPGPEAPSYYATNPPPVQQPMPQPSQSLVPQQPVPHQRITQSPPRRTIAETPPHTVPQVAPATTSPLNALPQIPQVPSVPVPPPLPNPMSNRTGVAPKVEPSWRPYVAPAIMPMVPEPTSKPVETPNVIVPIIRGSGPDFDNSPLAKLINEACRGLAKDVTITETGPRQLTISFKCTTTTLAELTYRAVSNLPELKAYSIDFKAGVIR